MQISRDEVEAEKAVMRAVDARPIKKIAEAKARKRRRLQVLLLLECIDKGLTEPDPALGAARLEYRTCKSAGVPGLKSAVTSGSRPANIRWGFSITDHLPACLPSRLLRCKWTLQQLTGCPYLLLTKLCRMICHHQLHAPACA